MLRLPAELYLLPEGGADQRRMGMVNVAHGRALIVAVIDRSRGGTLSERSFVDRIQQDIVDAAGVKRIAAIRADSMILQIFSDMC